MNFSLLRFIAIISAILLTSQLTACGQRGPLYLPSKPDADRSSTPQTSSRSSGQSSELLENEMRIKRALF